MEGISASLYKRLKKYWKRKAYVRLNGSGRRRRNRVELAQLGSKRRRFWKIKVSPKLRGFIKFSSPKKFFVWLRDAYVNMMMGFANSRICTAGYGGHAYESNTGFGRGPLKEYDEKMIVEIYKSLVAMQGQLVSRDAAKLTSISQRLPPVIEID
ncbi:hypothetical protein RJ641_030839 [Dillenia turbinata]|uniref:Uncharacterized protein n=1 Tax=Dillenia turbinata TaxID=194707 RepID=A0AAN8VX05_9MAGN